MEIGKELASALVALQTELKPAAKSAVNPFYKNKYVPLPEVRELLQPILEKHKLTLISVPTIIDGENGLKFYLIHESGQSLSGEWKLNPTKNDPQAVGSAVTYLRRYGDMAMTGMVADEDDDGQKSSTPSRSPAGPTKKQIDTIKNLAAEKNIETEAVEKRLSTIKTAEEASAAIKSLMEMK